MQIKLHEMDEIFDRIKATKIKRKYLIGGLIAAELLGIFVFVWFLRAPLAQKFFTEPPEAYSVISLSPQKRYLLSQGDLLTGRAIPNTTVKVLITPEFTKSSVTANSKGDWWYQVPPNLQTNIHRITFGNFDKSNKLVTFQTYKFRVQSNISIFNFSNSVRKRITILLSPQSANAQVLKGIDQNLYANVGLPPPSAPITIAEDERFRLINYFLPYAYAAAKITGTDWRLMAMFLYREDHITNYLDNCLDSNKAYGPDADHDPNTPCTGWGIPQWQVGWGIYPAQWANENLAKAIAAMRPGKTIQEIGQEVIDSSYDLDRYATFDNPHEKDPITYPDRFPDNVTLEEIIEGSQPILSDGKDPRDDPTQEEKNLVIGTQTCRPTPGKNTNPRQDPKDCYMRQLLGILMKDPAVSAFLLASMWENLSNEQQVINEIQYQWGRNEKVLQEASNIIAGIENAAAGIDLEAIAITPQITMPVAVAGQSDGVQVETVVSENGNAMDDQQISDQNLKRELQVVPYGSSPGDFQQPTSENNVRGISNIEEVILEPDALANPSQYQICALLKPMDYDVIIDYECIPLGQVINPQIPLDQPNEQTTVSACPLNPEAGEFECIEGVCRSTEYDCSSGRRWYFDEYKNPQNSCEFEAKANAEGEFAGLWYHGDPDPSCEEQPALKLGPQEPTEEDPAPVSEDNTDLQPQDEYVETVTE